MQRCCTFKNTALERENRAKILAVLLGKEMSLDELVAAAGLKEREVNRSLKLLVADHWVVARTVPDGSYPIKVRFLLSKHGEEIARKV